MLKNGFLLGVFIFSAISLASCSDDCEMVIERPVKKDTPADILVSVPVWRTTTVKVESTGLDVTALNPNVVGLASYKMEGTYEIKSMAGILRNTGNYAITPDGLRRILNATSVYDSNGVLIPNASFTRITDIVTITKNNFTYRIPGVAVPGGEPNVNVLVEHVPN